MGVHYFLDEIMMMNIHNNISVRHEYCGFISFVINLKSTTNHCFWKPILERNSSNNSFKYQLVDLKKNKIP